jgi:hypothetical protein
MNIIWVSVDGSDNTGDGTRASPYATIQHAIDNFTDGDQIRILDGTYIPTDSVIISGMSGSIFAENYSEVYIQPEKTKNHQACVAIIDAERFRVQGINIIQAADSGGNLIGMYVENVENFLAYTCSVTNFEIPSGNGYGIFAAGGGRIENCTVANIAGAGTGNFIYGIKGKGVDIIDCTVTAMSGAGNCGVEGISYEGFRD